LSQRDFRSSSLCIGSDLSADRTERRLVRLTRSSLRLLAKFSLRYLQSHLGSDRSRAQRNHSHEDGTGKASTIPISPPLMEIFHSIPRALCGVYYYELWQRACKRAKLAGLHFHYLRHTAVTRLADASADPFTIAAILGHASIQMTARYSHATSVRTRGALEKLASTLSQPANIPTADDPANRSAWRNILRKHG
jgi:integrase